MQPPAPNPNCRSNGDSCGLTPWPPVGLIVADPSLKSLFANQDAIAILAYPGTSSPSVGDVFQKKVHNLFKAQGSSPYGTGAHPFVKLKSGRRTYFCRAFLLQGGGQNGKRTATLLVLERGISAPLALSHVSREFHLTPREQQAVALLLKGLSNKEMADTMGVTPNTVKAFLRTAMIRMGASARSGIITKILNVLLSTSSDVPTRRDLGKAVQAF